MQDKKVTGEFAAKISKAKILYDNTSTNCIKLRKEAAQLQKQYQTLHNQRVSAEALEKSLKDQLDHTTQLNKEENQKCQRQTRQLNDLRKNKKDLKREKDILESVLLKATLQLQQLVQEREKLQATAKSLSERLEGVTSEKQILISEYDKTNKAIQKYNRSINNLKAQIQEIREVISSNTVPVYNNQSMKQHSQN